MKNIKIIAALLLGVLLLVACSQKFNQDINEQYAEDTVVLLQSIDDMTDRVDDINDLEEDDEDIITLLDYIDDHLGQLYEGDEEVLYTMVNNMVGDIGEYFADKDKFKKDKKKVESILYE